MKINKLTRRLRKDRPMTMVSIRIPEDVIEDLKRVAPVLGFSGYQALIKAYIGQGLRADLERLEGDNEVSALIEGLRKRGVAEKVISSAISDVRSPYRVVPKQRAKRNSHLLSPQPGKSK